MRVSWKSGRLSVDGREVSPVVAARESIRAADAGDVIVTSTPALCALAQAGVRVWSAFSSARLVLEDVHHAAARAGVEVADEAMEHVVQFVLRFAGVASNGIPLDAERLAVHLRSRDRQVRRAARALLSASVDGIVRPVWAFRDASTWRLYARRPAFQSFPAAVRDAMCVAILDVSLAELTVAAALAGRGKLYDLATRRAGDDRLIPKDYDRAAAKRAVYSAIHGSDDVPRWATELVAEAREAARRVTHSPISGLPVPPHPRACPALPVLVSDMVREGFVHVFKAILSWSRTNFFLPTGLWHDALVLSFWPGVSEGDVDFAARIFARGCREALVAAGLADVPVRVRVTWASRAGVQR